MSSTTGHAREITAEWETGKASARSLVEHAVALAQEVIKDADGPPDGTERYPGARYADQVRVIADGFEYESCAECGEDLDRHAISPDPLGNAHAWCLTDALSDALDEAAQP